MCRTRHLAVGVKHPDFSLKPDEICKNCIKKIMPVAITLQIVEH